MLSNVELIIIIVAIIIIVCYFKWDDIRERFRVIYPKFNVIPKGVWPSGFPYHVKNRNMTAAINRQPCESRAPEHTLAPVMPCHECGNDTIGTLRSPDKRLCRMGDVQATCGEWRRGTSSPSPVTPLARSEGTHYAKDLVEFDGVTYDKNRDHNLAEWKADPKVPSVYDAFNKEMFSGKKPVELKVISEDDYFDN